MATIIQQRYPGPDYAGESIAVSGNQGNSALPAIRGESDSMGLPVKVKEVVSYKGASAFIKPELMRTGRPYELWVADHPLFAVKRDDGKTIDFYYLPEPDADQ